MRSWNGYQRSKNTFSWTGPLRVKTERKTLAPPKPMDLPALQQRAARLKEAKGIGTPATRDTVIEGLKRQGLLELEKKKLKASKLAMAVYALLRREAPEVLNPAATADMERRLDDILSARQDADAVISALAGHAATFNEKMRARADGHGKPLDVKTIGGNGGAPSPAALAYARKIAAASGGKIPKQTLADRNRLSQWIDAHKSDAPTEKQVTFARSIAAHQRIAIPPEVLRSRAALSAWISTQAGGE